MPESRSRLIKQGRAFAAWSAGLAVSSMLLIPGSAVLGSMFSTRGLMYWELTAIFCAIFGMIAAVVAIPLGRIPALRTESDEAIREIRSYLCFTKYVSLFSFFGVLGFACLVPGFLLLWIGANLEQKLGAFNPSEA